MPSLIEIVKERAAKRAACSIKRADLAEFESRLSQGDVNPSTAVPEFEQAALEHYRDMIRSGQMAPADAHRLLRKRLADRDQVERRAFESNTSIYAPTYTGAAVQLGVGAGLGWGLGQISRLWGRKPPSFISQVGNMLLPRNAWGLLPLGIGGAFYGLRAAQDPAYQRGDAGYFESLVNTLSASGREMRKGMAEANQRYGVLGAMPLHAFGIVSDPIGAIMAGGTKLKDVMFGKEGELLDKAAEAVDRALRDR